MNKGFSALFKKLKSIKHIEIILAVLFAIIILLVYFSSVSSSNSSQTKSTISAGTSISAYTNEIENKLENLLSSIDGAGQVEVMVMLKDNTSLEISTLPSINSVVIVASGATDVWVKLEMIKAVQALLNLNSANIEVLIGKSG